MACCGHQRRQKTAANRNPPGDGVVQIGACGGWRHTEELVVRCNVWIRRQPPLRNRDPAFLGKGGGSDGVVEKTRTWRGLEVLETRSLGDAPFYGEAGYGAGIESDNYALRTLNMLPNLTFTTDIECL